MILSLSFGESKEKMIDMEIQKLLSVSARLNCLCAVMDFIAKAANENIYGNILFSLADSLNRISDDLSEALDNLSAPLT